MKIARTFVAFLALFIVYDAHESARAEPPRERRIGVIVPLTGDMAVHGVEVKRAMEMAAAETTPSPGQLPPRLIFEDNQLSPAKSVTAAHRLLDVEHVDAVVTLWPPAAEVVIPLTEKSETLHYTISWDPGLAKRHRFVLSHQVMVSDIARSTLAQLRKDGRKSIAFLHLEETGFNLGAEFIRELAPGYGLRLTSDESFAGTETDFRSLVNRIESAGPPDAYLLWSVNPSMDILISQIRARRKSAPISGYLDYAAKLDAIESSTYVSEMYASPGFFAAYRKRHDEPPVSKGANAYDVMKLLMEALEKEAGPKPDAAAMKAFLTTKKNVVGAVGLFSIDEEGNSSYLPVARRIERGERVLVGVAK